MIETRDGTELFVNDWGEGRAVVLIHGWPLSSAMWEYQAPALASQGLRVISYDRRGFGKSDQPWEGYDYDTFADDLADVLEALDVTDAILVGFSMGGGEIARYLTRYGHARIGGVVLLSSVVPYLVKDKSNPNGVPVKVFDTMVEKLNDDRPAFIEAFGPMFYGPTVSQATLQWTSQMALHASPKATIDSVRAFSETDFRPDLASFNGVPVLIIHGSGDMTVPIGPSGKAAAKAIEHAQLIVYKGAPHGLFITRKTQLTRDLLDFAHGA